MLRLFSTFARGWPGVGLLLLRLVVGITLIWPVAENLNGEHSVQLTIFIALATGLGLLLIIGLWTPCAGALVALMELYKALWQPGDPWNCILLATIGAALALLGPGSWSADARAYGWRKIDLPPRNSN